MVIYFLLRNSPEGRTKLELAKLLYYSDGVYFQRNGKMITNETYIRLESNPEPIRLHESLMYLSKNDLIFIQPIIKDDKLKEIKIFCNKIISFQLELSEMRKIIKVTRTFHRGVFDEGKNYPNLYETYLVTPLYTEIPFTTTAINTKIHFVKKKRLIDLSGKLYRVDF